MIVAYYGYAPTCRTSLKRELLTDAAHYMPDRCREAVFLLIFFRLICQWPSAQIFCAERRMLLFEGGLTPEARTLTCASLHTRFHRERESRNCDGSDGVRMS